MSKISIWARMFDAVRFFPVWIAYRLIWLAAMTRYRDAEDVYVAMWGAGLDLPPIDRLDGRVALFLETLDD